jgi:hypothetical protein
LTPADGFLGASALIQVRFLLLALRSTVIGGTAVGGGRFAVRLPAAERTPQVATPGIAGVRQEENPAMPAAGQAGSQVRLGSQHRSQQPVIFQDQDSYRALTVPVGLELEMPCDRDCKKAKLELRMLR